MTCCEILLEIIDADESPYGSLIFDDLSSPVISYIKKLLARVEKMSWGSSKNPTAINDRIKFGCPSFSSTDGFVSKTRVSLFIFRSDSSTSN